MIEKFGIYIQDIGDSSVGIQPMMVMTGLLDQNFVQQLKEDNTLEEFKERLTQLVTEYFEPEVGYTTYDDDDIKKEVESEIIAEEAFETGRNL